MSDVIQKTMNIQEFREKGYLREVNRRFFHPLGLAMFVNVDDDGTEIIGGIYDCRDDEIGYAYGGAEGYVQERNKKFAEFIDAEIEKRAKARIKSIGSVIQPADHLLND